MCKNAQELSESKEKAAGAAFLSFSLRITGGLSCRDDKDYGEYA